MVQTRSKKATYYGNTYTGLGAPRIVLFEESVLGVGSLVRDMSYHIIFQQNYITTDTSDFSEGKGFGLALNMEDITSHGAVGVGVAGAAVTDWIGLPTLPLLGKWLPIESKVTPLGDGSFLVQNTASIVMDFPSPTVTLEVNSVTSDEQIVLYTQPWGIRATEPWTLRVVAYAYVQASGVA